MLGKIDNRRTFVRRIADGEQNARRVYDTGRINESSKVADESTYSSSGEICQNQYEVRNA